MVKPFVLTFLSCVCATLSVYARATDVLIRTVDPTIAETPDSIPVSLPNSIPVSLPDSILTTLEKDEPVVYEPTSEADSIIGSTYNLDEVVIEADKEVRLKNGMAYYPGEEVKKFSYDGINLLSRMIIPTLRVNPFNNTVTSMSGGDVTYFINGMRSTYEEVMAIDPRYINRIDVLQNPTEAKYQGAETVIDYVVTRYLWGGFTKVAAAGGIPSLFANGDIQSGFTYKRMTYNIYLSSSYSKLYDSSESLERFSIDDIPCSIKSEDKLSKGHTTGQKGYVSALYESTNVKFKNTITLNHSLKPHIILAGRTNYLVGDNPLLEVATERSNHSNNLNPGWSTSLSLYFPSDIALYVNGDVKLRNNNSNTRKIQSENDVTVWENSYSVRETGSDSKLSVSFSKTWNSVHRFSISADCSYNFYRLAYHGSVETISKVAEWRSNLKAAYTFIWKRGQLNTSLFGNYNKSGFGKAYKGTQRFTPSGYVDLIINPSRNQQFSARVGYYPGNYPLSQIDPTLIQTNLLLWTRGNPSIKSISSMITSLGYKWWNSHVSIYAYLNNGVNFNNLYRTATPTEDGNGLILSYAQGTDWITTSLGVSTSWFITREFALAASGTVINFRKTKPVNDNKFRAQGSFQFQWFRSKYGVYASVSSPSYQDGFNGYVRGSMNYGIGGSAILGNWRLSLSVYNPFYNTKMREQWSKVPGGLYTVSVKNFSKHNSTKVVLSATYTIRYGKREMQQTLEDIKVDNSLMQ